MTPSKRPLQTSLLLGCLALLLTGSALAKDSFKVAILIFDDVQIIDFTAPYEVFGQAGFDVFTVSKDGKPITTVMGMKVTPTHSFAKAPQANAILIPGGNVHNAMADKAIQQWLQNQQKTSDHLLSVCTGAHILAESGLLDGLSATTFHRALSSFSQNYPAIRVQTNQRFVDNGQIITSAGLSSGIDASLHLVGKVLGLEKAKTLAMHLEYDWKPKGGFVRTNMADKHLPSSDFEWPKSVTFNRLNSYGDETSWTTTFKAKTNSVETLVGTYQKGMKKYDDWLPETTNTSNVFQWRGHGKNQHWQHELLIKPTNVADEFIVSKNIKRLF